MSLLPFAGAGSSFIANFSFYDKALLHFSTGQIAVPLIVLAAQVRVTRLKIGQVSSLPGECGSPVRAAVFAVSTM